MLFEYSASPSFKPRYLPGNNDYYPLPRKSYAISEFYANRVFPGYLELQFTSPTPPDQGMLHFAISMRQHA